MPFDLITMGRVGVDLYPEQIGVPLADVHTFAKSLGGSATNVAVAAARLGARAAVITKVGDDPFGPYVRGALRGFGVDDAFVSAVRSGATPPVTTAVRAPSRAAATATFVGLPPSDLANVRTSASGTPTCSG